MMRGEMGTDTTLIAEKCIYFKLYTRWQGVQ